MAFKKAERKNAKLRMALAAISGGGKTYTALQIGKLFDPRVAVMDSERGSSEKYARKANTPEGPGNWDFDVENLEDKTPQEYIATIQRAAAVGYPVLLIDSYSHAWLGALEQIDAGGGWQRAGKNVSPLVQRLVDSILSYPGHVITTMRSKAEHVIEKDEKTGRSTMRKVGMQSVAREGTEFEFDLMFDLSDGNMTVTKTRFQSVPIGAIYQRHQIPKLVETIKAELDAGGALSVADQLLEKIRFCQSVDGLAPIAESIKAAQAGNAVDTNDRERLKKAYLSKKAELTGAA